MNVIFNRFLRTFSVLLLAASMGVCAAQDDGAFNLVLLPDTQMYAQDHPEIFHAQTRWIADNASTITFVLHQGDITNRNNEAQWKVAVEAMARLDGKVPYTLTIGNHDIGTTGTADTRDTSLFNRSFPFDKYNKTPEFGGAFEAGRMDNTWYKFRAGGHDWIILCLEFGPRDAVLEWANKVVADHPNAKVIVNTHAYMYSDDTRMGREAKWNPHTYGLAKDGGPGAVNDGEEIWTKLVSRHPNILMVVSGHVLNDGVGTLVSEGQAGNRVYQMLANYQRGVKGAVDGGNGFLRILRIDPAAGTIGVTTYSPHVNEFKREADQQFEFTGVAF